MASATPLVDALAKALRGDNSGSSYVSHTDGGITIDGWWEDDSLEETLREVFQFKEN